MEETHRSDASLHLMDSDDLILTCCDLSSWKLNPLSLQRRGQPGYRGTTTTPSKATANRGLTHTTLSFLALKPRGRAAEPAATWQILQVIYSPHGNPTLYLLSFPPTPRSHRPAAPRPFPAPRFPHYFPVYFPGTQPEEAEPQTPCCTHLGQVELPDLAADVLGQAAGEGDHPRQLLGVPLDQLQVGAAHKTHQSVKKLPSCPKPSPSFLFREPSCSQAALEGAVGGDERPFPPLVRKRRALWH